MRRRPIALEPRTIQFIDRQKPALPAGRYTIDGEHVVETSPAKKYSAQQKLLVQAARFRPFGEDVVQSFFPPRGSSGQFQNDLPQIVLNDPSLPWQRAIPGGGADTPWLALLLFEREEILSSPDTATGIASLKLSQVFGTPESGVYGPQNLTLEEGQTMDDICSAIDIKPDTFKRVVPYLSELDYLAHCRNVDVRQKANAVAVSDGLFSLIIGNRFPKAAAETSYVVHLVSLEGFAQSLNAQFQFSNVQRVRLVSLAGWNFTCRAGANFGELMTNLVATASKPEDLLLRLPAPTGEGAAFDMVRKAFSRGFVGLGYDTRSGESTFAWYRGPFSTERIRAFGTQYEGGSAAAIYDETTGTFDLTYAAAWQIGRLMALSDGSYATAKVGLRRRVRHEFDVLRENARLRDFVAAKLMSKTPARDELFHWIANELPAVLEGREVATFTSVQAATTPEGFDELEGLLQQDLASTAVKMIAARELSAVASGPVVHGDASLRLFYDVPVDLLVPDARLLPPESIRFFYVDPNYLDAMVQGAHSVGIDSSRTRREQLMMNDAIDAAVSDAACCHRANLIGEPGETAAAGTPVAGFLLRSALVSGWPGLEIVADRASGEVVVPLRLQVLAQTDILLALYPVAPDRISFTEPRESLTFGTDEQMRIQLRNITGEVGKTTGSTATIDVFRNDGRVVDVAALQDSLRKVLGAANWGPAAFALQMIRAPRRMWFYNPQLPPPAQLQSGMEETAHV